MSASSVERIVEEGLCIGCGLCASVFPDKVTMQVANTGFLRPQMSTALNSAEENHLETFCPGVVQAGLPENLADENPDPVWGSVLQVNKVHAAKPETRHRAATGGSLSALCEYLVDNGIDVLHVKNSTTEPTHGETHISNTRADVDAAAGSVYGPAAPLEALVAKLDLGKPFAIVAKPCDISAVRLYARTDERVNDLVKYMLVMVCGGFMPPFGMRAFYQRVGINEDDVKSVRYRGNGCPGPTRIETKDGQVFEETYLDFWGTEASMWHLPWRCKICADGTGEGADIAAADTWPGGSPTTEMLTNDPGSNGIIVRTQNGKDLVERAIAADYLVNEGPATIEDLNDWQPHQVNKKMAAESRYEGCRRSGHRGLRVEGMQTEALRKQLDADVDEQQVRGTMERIAIGKHRDDFGMQE